MNAHFAILYTIQFFILSESVSFWAPEMLCTKEAKSIAV